MESNNITMSTVTIDSNFTCWAGCYAAGKLYAFDRNGKVRAYDSNNNYVESNSGTTGGNVPIVYVPSRNSLLFNTGGMSAFNIVTNVLTLTYFGLPTGCFSVTTDGTYIYLILPAGKGKINKCDLSGNILIDGWTPASDLYSDTFLYTVCDGTYIYYGDGSNNVTRITIGVSSGTVQKSWIPDISGTTLNSSPSLAVDANYLYVGLSNVLVSTTYYGRVNQYNKLTGALINALTFALPTNASGTTTVLGSTGTSIYIKPGGSSAILLLTPPVLTTGNVNPNITSIVSQANTLLVSFTGSSNDAYPVPFYYYSVNGSPFANTGLQNANSSIVLKQLPVANSYSIQLSAVNSAGNLLSANTVYTVTNGVGLQNTFMNQFMVYGRALTTRELDIIKNFPNVVSFNSYVSAQGTYPIITQVYSNINSLIVSYVGTPDANPPPYYYYTVSSTGSGTLSGNTGVNATNGNLVIPNLTVTGNYRVQLTAVNLVGNVVSANAFGQPYTLGTNPNIISVANLANALSVSFQGVSNWYPLPNYYYSISGNLPANYLQANVSANAFTISNLTTFGSRTIYFLANNLVGNSYSTTLGTGSPYVVGTATPNISSVTSGVNSLIVSFTGAQNAYTEPFYYYSSDGGNTFSNSGLNTDSANIVIPNLTVASQYTVQLRAVNPAGNLVSGTATGTPYVLGTKPNIISVEPLANALAISFQPSANGYDTPYYYYSLNGNVPGAYLSADLSGNANSFVVSNLTANITATVSLLAQNAAGNVYSASTVSMTPYVLGNAGPEIQRVISGFNSLTVQFATAQNANPAPYYYYSVNGSEYVNSTFNSNAANIVIQNLTVANTYSVSIMAVNPAGNVATVNSYGQPYVLGTQPNINSITSLANAISVAFQTSVDGYPAPVYYYSLNGNSASSYIAANIDSNASVLTISNLTTTTIYNVNLLAQNAAGNVYSNNSVAGQPFTLGTSPSITGVESGTNSLIVSFNGTENAYPAPYYYYSYDGGVTFFNSGLDSNVNIVISGLTTYGNYTVQLMAVNPAGNLYSGFAEGSPYVTGNSAPNITQIQSGANSLVVSFTGSIGVFPVPFYYYSVNGSAFSNSGLNSSSAGFVIGNLTENRIYSVQLMAVNSAGNVQSGISYAQPYVLGTSPNITQIQSNANSLIVSFAGSTDSYPAPYYYYSVNGSVFSNSGYNTAFENIVIPNLTTKGNYTIQLLATNPAGNLLSTTVDGQPYVLGTNPQITTVSSNINSLDIQFAASTDAYTDPVYYYSVDGQPYVDAGVSSNADIINIPGLTTAAVYTVSLMAVNPAGNIYSNTESGEPYIVGSASSITQVDSGANSLVVYFQAPTDWYPNPFYYYSIDGVNYANSYQNSNTQPLIIPNLYTPTQYYVQLLSVGVAGNLSSDNAYQGIPYVLGTNPQITRISSAYNSLVVKFAASYGGYPVAQYYYSVDGQGFVDSGYTSNSSDITISGLTEARSYNIQLMAVNPAGNLASNSDSQTPYVIGTTPTINSITPGVDNLSVDFNLSTGGYPTPFYYYSVDGINYANSQQNSNASPLIIPDLYMDMIYTVYLKAVSIAGSTGVSTGQGEPYVIGNAMVITQVDPSLNALIVSFTDSVDGNPSPSSYYYSTDGGANYTSTGGHITSPYVITGLSVAQDYTIVLVATNTAGNTDPSAPYTAKPYVIGTAPIITTISPSLNQLSVEFTGPVGGSPEPATYYYSLDGGSTYTDALSNVSPIVVSNLFVAQVYSVVLLAQNLGGNTAASSSYDAEPYVIGTAPNITSVESGVNQLSIYYTGSTAGYPAPTTYLYSLDGGNNYVDPQSNVSPIVVSSLNVAQVYQVTLIAVNAGGSSAVSNVVSGEPYVVGTGLDIDSITSGINSLTVEFSGLTGGYPDPIAYYYSVDGAAYVLATSNVTTSSFVIENLTEPRSYNVQMIAQNLGGNTSPTSTKSGIPYIVGNPATITSVVSGVNQLTVYYSPSLSLYPAATAYYYSTGGSYYDANADLDNNVFVIGNLYQAMSYPITIVAHNAAGNTAASNTAYGEPYVAGIMPNITSITSLPNSLSVAFQASTGAYPTPFYFYTVDGGNTYVNSYVQTNSSPIIIPDLKLPSVYTVQLAAINAWGTLPGSIETGQPYVIGTQPVIQSITPGTNTLSVQFQDSANAYPTPYYYYSTDGGSTYVNALVQTNASPIIISGLTVAQVYNVSILAVNAGGNTASDSVPAEPYVIGTQPNITALTPGLANTLTISFNAALNANPAPYYYYSVNGSAYSNANVNSNASPIIIDGLTSPNLYTISLKGVSVAGNTTISEETAHPYVFGSIPVINSVSSNTNSLTVSFSPSVGGYPDPTAYYYSVDGGNTYINAGTTTSPMTLLGLTVARTYYIQIVAENAAGNTQPSATDSGTPYVIGSAPTINSVSSIPYGVIVSFTGTTDGYPAPTTYYYSVDEGTTYVDSLTTTSPFEIHGLDQNTTYLITLKTQNLIGNTAASTSSPGTPYILGTVPQISNVVSIYNGLSISFSASTGGNPLPSSYLYSLDGGVSFIDSGITTSPIIVSGLTTPTVYSVAIQANNLAGNTAASNVVNGEPYVIGTAPQISNVSSIYNGLSVVFSPSTGGYPEPNSYYYSLDGGFSFSETFANTSPLLITGITTAGVYSVALLANSAAGQSNVSNVVSGQPYIIGSAPTNVQVQSLLNSISVSFTASTDGYPDPSSYFYSLNGGSTFTDSLSNVSPITVSNLSTSAQYSVVLYANSIAGRSSNTTPVAGRPYVIGSTPNISSVQSGYNSITINYSASAGGYPDPATYYYTLDGGNTFVDGQTQSTQIVLSGLTNANTYSVGIKAGFISGNTGLSNLMSGTPYVIGLAPNITSVQSITGGVNVYFSGSESGYPNPTSYFYSVDGGVSFTDSGNTSSPIVITGLTNLSPYSFALSGFNAQWPASTPASNLVEGQPYIVGTAPAISEITSGLNSLSVSFSLSVNGYPEPTSYFYSVDGGNTFIDSGSNISPIQISNLSVAKTYSVSLYANSLAGPTGVSNMVPGDPYVLGTVPIIGNITSLPYAMSVSFTGSLNGYPEPTTYFYSVDGGATFTNSLTNQSPMLISFANLTTPDIYSVAIYASGTAGNTAASAVLSGRPFVVGTAPVISNITSRVGGLSVSFTGSTGGYPDATQYLYSVNAGATYQVWGNTNSPIIISGLTSATQYSVKLLAVNAAGNSAASNTEQGTPYLTGTAPSNVVASSIVNGLSIAFNPPQNAYPDATTYYYSLNGGSTFVDANSTSSPIIVGNLTQPATYSVVLYAVNEAGSGPLSTAVSGSPYIIGSAPQIANVVSGYNSITINFTGSSGGSAGSTYYYYSLDGGATFTNSTRTESPIVVSSLTQAAVYQVVLYSVSPAGQSANSNTVEGRPYVIGTAPTIQSVVPVEGSSGTLAVNYTAPTNGYPDPYTYYYRFTNVFGSVATNLNSTATPLIISGIVFSGVYNVEIYASSLAGNTPSSLAVSGRPYILGSTPVIRNIVPSLNKLTVSFNLSTGGFPNPTTYLYTLDGQNYVDSLRTASPIEITGLTQAVSCTVAIKASGLAGNTAPSNTVISTPYIIGSIPSIQNVVPGINQLSVYFTQSTGGNPGPQTYLYSIDGTNYVDSLQNSNAAPIVIRELYTPSSYPIYLKAQSLAGTTATSSPAYGIPYVQGSTPTINSVDAIPGRSGALAITFEPSTGGYPAPSTYYYSVDGGITFQDSRSVANPLVITGLSLQSTPYLVSISARSSGWNSAASVAVPGVPYVVGSPLVVSNVSSVANGLVVSFTDAMNGYPDATAYYYTVDGGSTFTVSGNATSPALITGLTTANVYSVGMIAGSLGGNTAISNLLPGTPHVIGQAPVILGVSSGPDSLSVAFSPPVGGTPAPSAYYYSLDLGNTYTLANGTTSPIIISGLSESKVYTVQLKAQNVVGNTAASAQATGEPYTQGTDITVSNVASRYNGLDVYFTPPTGWNPPMNTYYYSLDGTNYVLANTTSSPITILGLTTAIEYSVSLRATNAFGIIAGSNTVIGEPWVIGTPPTIQRIYNVLNGISVSFVGSQSGYPAPSTYLYSIDGGNTYLDSGTNRSPVVIKGPEFEEQRAYTVSLKAVNSAGTTGASNTLSGNSYVVGNSPSITGVQSILNGLVVSFTPPAVQYATPIVYMYSLDGVNYVDTGCTTSPLTIGNLTVAGSYNISIKGVLQLSNVSAPFYLS